MSDEKTRSFSEELAEIVKQEGSIEEDAAPESQPEKAEEALAPSQEESQVEEKKEEETPEPQPENSASKKEVPFHKHPRWIRLQKELEEAREEARKARETAEQRREPVAPQTDVKVPPQFAHLFGEDVDAYKAWQSMLTETSRSEAKALFEQMKAEEKAQAEQDKQARAQAVQYAEDQFFELEDETGIDFTNRDNTARNQILDICAKYQLFTDNGMPNIRVANELRAALYPEKNVVVEEKKRVASKAASPSTAPAPKSDVMTPQRLKEIERLGGMAYLLNQ